MSQKEPESSDLIMGLFGFTVIVVGSYAIAKALDVALDWWSLWFLVIAGGGMVLGVAISNKHAAKFAKSEKKTVVAKKATKKG